MKIAERVRAVCSVVILGLVIAALYHQLFGHSFPSNTFLYDPNERYEDFHHINDFVRAGNPYGSDLCVYFPFAYVPLYALRPLGREASLWTFILASSAAMFAWMYSRLRALGPARAALASAGIVFLSYPYLFWADRANLESLVFVALAAFFTLLDRRPRWAALALGAAAAIKLYPAVFGVLYLRKRDLRSAALAAVSALVLSVVPAALYPGGLRISIALLLKYLLNFKHYYILKSAGLHYSHSYYSWMKLVAWFGLGWRWSPDDLQPLQRYYTLGSLVLFALVVVYVLRIDAVRWRQVALLTFVTLLLPQVSFDYKLIHLFFPLALFLERNDPAPTDRRNAELFGLLLIPKAYGVVHGTVTGSVLLTPVLMTAFAAMIVAQGFSDRAEGARLLALSTMKIAPGCIVRIEYELKVKGGEVIETSARTGPLQYVQGEGKFLPALEKRLEGLSAGQSLEGEIPAAEAFPEAALPSKVIKRAEFPKDAGIEVGAMFEAHTQGGSTVAMRVIAADAETVTVRFLPPIAGKDLTFKVKVIMLEDPALHTREIVARKPPPPPVEALKLDVELIEDN